VPSRSEGHVRAAIVAAMMVATTLPSVRAQQAPVVSAVPPDRVEIERAIAVVKADPNLATDRVIKTLRWKPSTSTSSFHWPGWLSWIGGLVFWMGESARVLVWCAALALAGLVAVYLSRIARTRLMASSEDTFVAPTHVRDLDIRPESLPDDIGAAARALWERGDQRAALALLYRGTLSRLAHVHRVPIRESSTEGDCVALAVSQLPEKSEYVGRLVRVWQRLGYGHEPVESATVHGLCDEFNAALPRSAA